MDSENGSDVNDRVGKMENVLQDFGKFFVSYRDENFKKMDELTSLVNHLKEEVVEMKVELHKIKEDSRRNHVNESNNSAPKGMSSNIPSSSPSRNPRAGNYSSDDVDISSVFSNAHNRMGKK
jgi:hypothetical protein